MENASQALLIAGSILIALIILSIGVYLVANYAKVSESYENTQALTEITKFNANFTAFEGRNDITAQEIVTLNNLVKEYNDKNDPDIIINPKIGEASEDGAKFIKDNDGKKFRCESVNYDNSTGRVSSITFI